MKKLLLIIAILTISSNAFAEMYLTCNATGWQPDDSTRLVETAASRIDKEIIIDVTEQWMVDSGDTCKILITNEYNGWGTEQYYMGTYISGDPAVINYVEAPQSGRVLSSDESFTVKYPALGTYRFVYYAARAAFAFEAVE